MAHLDLDAARVARAEQAKEPKTFTLAGQTFHLPNEFPMRVAALWADEHLDESLRVLLGDADYDRFSTITDLSADDVKALVAGIGQLYGFEESGESSASVVSSSNGSRRSRQTSRAATG